MAVFQWGPLTGASNAVGGRPIKYRDFRPISCFTSEMIQYRATVTMDRIGTPIRRIEWCYFQWRWVISNPDFKARHYMMLNISDRVYDRDIDGPAQGCHFEWSSVTSRTIQWHEASRDLSVRASCLLCIGLYTYFPAGQCAHSPCKEDRWALSYCDTRPKNNHSGPSCGVSIVPPSILWVTVYGKSRRNAFMRHRRGRPMSWSGVWLKRFQQSERPLRRDRSTDRSEIVCQSRRPTLWTFRIVLLYDIVNVSWLLKRTLLWLSTDCRMRNRKIRLYFSIFSSLLFHVRQAAIKLPSAEALPALNNDVFCF